MKPFREIQSRDLQSHALRDEIDRRGYLLIRELLPPPGLNRLLSEIANIIYSAGWLLPHHDPLERRAEASAACGDSDPDYKSTYEQIFNLESFHALAHHPALRPIMQLLVGPRLLIHPKPVGRLIFPHCERFVIRAHQDHQSIAGDAECFTAWMPLHDCPAELGPLQILEGSQRFGLQASDAESGIIAQHAALGGDWVGGEINAGDVLIFHSLTVHAASPNVSSQLRISMDCRFQDYGKAVNPTVLVFPGSATGRSWEKTYAGWRSDDLKYYWKGMPLQLQPSKTELAELAQNATSHQMRLRYSRMLCQIESQVPG